MWYATPVGKNAKTRVVDPAVRLGRRGRSRDGVLAGDLTSLEGATVRYADAGACDRGLIRHPADVASEEALATLRPQIEEDEDPNFRADAGILKCLFHLALALVTLAVSHETLDAVDNDENVYCAKHTFVLLDGGGNFSGSTFRCVEGDSRQLFTVVLQVFEVDRSDLAVVDENSCNGQ